MLESAWLTKHCTSQLKALNENYWGQVVWKDDSEFFLGYISRIYVKELKTISNFQTHYVFFIGCPGLSRLRIQEAANNLIQIVLYSSIISLRYDISILYLDITNVVSY